MFSQDKNSISEISSYSFFVYLIFLLAGLFIELFFFSQKLLSSHIALYVGVGLMTVSSIVILWAGHSSYQYRKNSDKYDELGHQHLIMGVFRFTRNPYYLSLGTLMIGLSLVINSLAIFALAVLSFLVVNSWFIPKEEEVLRERHGEHFDKYKDTTKRWF